MIGYSIEGERVGADVLLDIGENILKQVGGLGAGAGVRLLIADTVHLQDQVVYGERDGGVLAVAVRVNLLEKLEDSGLN